MIDGMRLAWRIVHQPPVAAGWQGPLMGAGGQLLDQPTVDSDTALADFIRETAVPSTIRWGRPRWGRTAIRWRWSISIAGCAVSMDCV